MATPTLEAFDPANLTAGKTYVVSANTTLSSNLTIPDDVTLYFMGGIISGNNVDLTGTRTKIVAAIKQIFGTTLNVKGTWEIERAYPQWFGAKAYTGITNNSIDSAPAINKAINMKQTGEVFIPRGHYRVNCPIEVKHGIRLIGEPGFQQDLAPSELSTVLVPGGVDVNGNADITKYNPGGYLVRVNVNSAGNNWVIAYPPKATVIKNLFFFNEFKNITSLKGILAAGTIEIDSCNWMRFKQAFSSVSVYTDGRKITKCAYYNAASQDSLKTPLYAFDINSLGDALVFEQNHILYDERSKGLYIDHCNSGSINANVINNEICIQNSKAITFTANHIEDGAQLIINDSNVTSMNNFFQKGEVPSIKVNTPTPESNAPVVK